jgi:hypothetical protein
MSVPSVIQDVIAVINQKLELSPKSDRMLSISLWDFSDDRGEKIPKDDLVKVLRRLEEDKVIKLTLVDHLNRLGRKAEDKVEFEIDRDKFSSFYNQHKKPVAPKVVSDTTVLYRVSYSEQSREILINGFLLAKPDFGLENEMVFGYIYQHPNERLSKAQIEQDLNISIGKSFHKIVENLGFKGDLRKTFFDISKTYIRFRNPVTKKDLDSLNIETLKLPLTN